MLHSLKFGLNILVIKIKKLFVNFLTSTGQQVMTLDGQEFRVKDIDFIIVTTNDEILTTVNDETLIF